MTDLTIPKDGPRVAPRLPEQVNADMLAEYDKTVRTWGIPNNLMRTMACQPRLGLTEVDYANSFIFDEGSYVTIPRPGSHQAGETVLFPAAGFIDRVTKELALSIVSLLNRSRYSITHHSVIATLTLSGLVAGDTAEAKAKRAEALLLRLLDGNGNLTFENQSYEGGPLYSDLQLAVLRLAVKINADAHSVTDAEIDELRSLLRADAVDQIGSGPLASQFDGGNPDDAYLDAYVDAMLVELTWCICHFSGLLNRWFTVLRVRDEHFAVGDDGNSFVDNYNAVIPESIKVRNNQLLGSDGWGSS